MADKKKKIDSAKKTERRNEKRRLRNRSFKSRVRTTLKACEAMLASGEQEQQSRALGTISSVMDKGVKKGIFKKNKAARVKARYAKQCLKSAS